MTANELAYKLEKVSNDMEHSYVVNNWKLLFESALVLRKQAKEIEQLKNCLFQMQNVCIDLTKQKPVAWIDPKELNMDVSTSVNKNKMFDKDIPLYTHPMRELTEDEIKDEWFDINKSALSRIEVDMQLIFARAILKKASEK